MTAQICVTFFLVSGPVPPQFVDKLCHAISRLKLTEQFDICSFLTSILHLCLSKSIQGEWEVHSNKIKGFPPIEDFLDYVMFMATVLSTQPTVPPTNVLDHKPEKRQERKPERKPEYYLWHRASMHVVTPSGGFKYECLHCSPEKHPPFMCAKFNTFNVNQCQEHLKTNHLAITVWHLVTKQRSAGAQQDARCVKPSTTPWCIRMSPHLLRQLWQPTLLLHNHQVYLTF